MPTRLEELTPSDRARRVGELHAAFMRLIECTTNRPVPTSFSETKGIQLEKDQSCGALRVALDRCFGLEAAPGVTTPPDANGSRNLLAHDLFSALVNAMEVTAILHCSHNSAVTADGIAQDALTEQTVRRRLRYVIDDLCARLPR